MDYFPENFSDVNIHSSASEDGVEEYHQSWEHDAGQAILDGQEDANWQLNATADELRLAYLGDKLRDAFVQLGDYPTSAESAAYLDCKTEHAMLQGRMDGAQAAFKQAVGVVDVETESYGRRESSVHSGSCVMPDGRLASVRHSVVLRSNESGLHDAYYSSAITVDTYVTYQDGLRPGDEVYNSNATPGRVSIYAKDMAVGDVATVVEKLAHNIRLDMHREAVEPWVESFMALPPPAVQPPADEEYGMDYMPLGMRAIFSGSADRDDAVTTLAFAFNGNVREDVQRILDTPLPDMIDKIQYYGVAERFAWLLEHAVDIQRDVIRAERQALDNRLPEAYMTWQAGKENIIDQLSELTDALRHLPSKPAPVDAQKGKKSVNWRPAAFVEQLGARITHRRL